jgi:phage virion morphogenesis protein
MFTIELNDAATIAVLNRAAARFDDMFSLNEEIGEILVLSTNKRFTTFTAPDGEKWKPRSPATIAKYGRKSNSVTSNPLVKDGFLSKSIASEPERDQVAIGSNSVYAAMMQAGGTKAQFPHLWGDIPERPYLGLSREDIADIVPTVEEWMAGLFAQP